METINNMPANARVWVYQSNRLLSDAEADTIQSSGQHFIAGWAAHGAGLKASFDILYKHFIVIAVDEQQAMASGCSIDKSLQFIKELEQHFHLHLLDRTEVAYRKGNQIIVCSLVEFEKLAEKGIVGEETIVFNNMVTTKATLDKEWEVPLKQSWQKRVLANK